MKRDVRETALYREIEALYFALRRPGTGLISDAADVHVSADGQRAAFAGAIMDSLEGAPATRICQVELCSGHTTVLTFGPNTDRLPKYSPTGQHIAFLSDRHQAGDFQLYLLDCVSGAACVTPSVEGWVEYLHWSPDGGRILLGVAGHGADISGGQGAVTSNQRTMTAPHWMPSIDTGGELYRWRRTWLYELSTNRVYPVTDATINIWEAVWCGSDRLAAVTSPGPGEGLWYSARLNLIQVPTGECTELYVPREQLAWPTGSPCGKHLAIVEAICSDRGVAAGDLRIIDTASGRVFSVETGGIDVSYTEWHDDRTLLIAGHLGLAMVVGIYDLTSDRFTETWRSEEVSTGGFHAVVASFNEPGDCVLIGEGFMRAPEIAAIRSGVYQTVRSFDLGYTQEAQVIEAVERISWPAPDGLDIQGWVLRPRGAGPHPLVMSVHGGPVWQSRSLWLGRRAVFLMLVKHGYAVFFPNPRGSTGRGQDFIRRVRGDIGGADTHDYLSGLDFLVDQGIADPTRLGVTGISYGGFMSAWLITQDARFAAAVPVALIANQVTEHLVSNIPHFVALFLADHYRNSNGRYFQRSPIMHADKVKTPTLNICGALDQCTPPTEAIQFHNALLENGVKSVLVTYPEEGHGIRQFPAVIDYATRVTAWFEEHMPAKRQLIMRQTTTPTPSFQDIAAFLPGSPGTDS